MGYKIRLFFNLYRGMIAYLLSKCSKNRALIFADLERWKSIIGIKGRYLAMTKLLMQIPAYRNLVCYRLRGFAKTFFLWHYKKMDTLFMGCKEIGAGFYIHHGVATVIEAKSIGENCFISQQVTLGYVGDEAPTLGNNVTVHPGAIILGGVHLGDNCTVGAGAVVLSDVAEGATVGCVPPSAKSDVIAETDATVGCVPPSAKSDGITEI